MSRGRHPTIAAGAGQVSTAQSKDIRVIRKGQIDSGRGQNRLQRGPTRRIRPEGEIQEPQPHPESMGNSSVPDDSGKNLGRIKCIVDVGENSIEVDPYVADFFFEQIFLSDRFPDLTCTAQVMGLEGGEAPLVNVEIVSKKRGERYDALRITSEELFSKPNKFSIVFGFDSERLKSPMQLEADVEVRNAGTPIIARINAGLMSSFDGSVSSNLSGVSTPIQIERSMTFWDWPLDNAILEIKADEDWMSQFGEIEVLHNGGKEGLRESVRLTSDFQEIDFSAIRPLMLPKDGSSHSPYHTCAYIILRLGRDGSELPIVSHLVDSRPSRRGSFGKIADLEDPDGWPYFLWRGMHFKEQPSNEKFLIKKGRLWEGFRYLDSEISDTIKRVQHERYTSIVPTRAWFGYKNDEFIVNWFHLDEYGWNVSFSD